MDLPLNTSTPRQYLEDLPLEDALRASEARFQAMFEQAMVGVAEYDLDGKHIFINPAYCQNLGYSCQELLDLSLKDIVHPDDYPACWHLFECAKTEGGSFLGEKRFRCKDGQFVWNADSVCALRDPQTGRTQSVVAVCIDITQRKQIEAELQHSHELLERRVQERTWELSRALEQQQKIEAARLELIKRVVNTQEEERGRISRELHDNLGQHLTGLMLGLQALEMQIEQITQRLGLLGMQERLSIVGGSLDIESTLGSGTTVFARVPLPSTP